MGRQSVLARGHDRFATRQPQVGITRQPDAQTLAEWALYLVRAYQMNSNPHGGWAPHRSQLVSWGFGKEAYYKAMDEGDSDLYWLMQPGDQHLFRPLWKLELDAHAMMVVWEHAVDEQADQFFQNFLSDQPKAKQMRFLSFPSCSGSGSKSGPGLR